MTRPTRQPWIFDDRLPEDIPTADLSALAQRGGNALDGTYSYELRFVPFVSDEARQQAAEIRAQA